MKKPAILALAALALLASCASMDKAALSRIDKAALVSLFCDRMIDASDFKGDLADMGKIVQSPSFDLKPVIVGLADDFFGKYAAELPFAIVDEAKVIDSPAYKRIAAEGGWDGAFYALPDDYAVIRPGDRSRMLDAIADVPEAKAAVALSCNFALKKDGFEVLGAGNARIRADIHLAVVDLRGRTVVETFTSDSSDSTVTYLFGGLFDASRLAAMCKEAAGKASRAMLRWIDSELRA